MGEPDHARFPHPCAKPDELERSVDSLTEFLHRADHDHSGTAPGRARATAGNVVQPAPYEHTAPRSGRRVAGAGGTPVLPAHHAAVGTVRDVDDHAAVGTVRDVDDHAAPDDYGAIGAVAEYRTYDHSVEYRARAGRVPDCSGYRVPVSEELRWQPYDPLEDEPLWARPPFPVFGLGEPTLGEGTVMGCVTTGSHLVSIELAWGDVLSPAGPVITVHTTSAREWAVHEPNLADVLSTERERLYDNPDAHGTRLARVSTAQLDVNTEAVLADVRREGTLWAARTRLIRDRPLYALPSSSVVVTVVGRGVPFTGVRLVQAPDLTLCLRRRRTLFQHLAERDIRLAGERWGDLRLAAHFALVDYEFADDPQLGHVRHGVRPRHNWEWGSDLWGAAALTHSKLTGQPAPEAEDALNCMVGHILHLSGSVLWFVDPAHRTAAIEETVRFTVDGGEPPSVAAQEAWRAVWDGRTEPDTLSPLSDDSSSEFDAGFMTGDAAWLAAWQDWWKARGG